MNTDVQTIDPAEVDASLRTSTGMGIHGLENVPTSAISLPIVKLVQPTSRDTELADGTDAPVGQFLFTSLGEVDAELRMAIISAHVGDHRFEDESGNPVTKTQASILAVDRTRNILFLTRFSATSLAAFGKLMSQIKNAGLDAAWDREVIVTSEKRESAKGKFWVAKFALGEPVSETDAQEYTQTWMSMSDYFEREDAPDGSVA